MAMIVAVRLAVVFLDQFASPTEAVETGFGWVAYESRRVFVDGSGLNSGIQLPATSLVLSSSDASAAEAAAREYVPLARFGMADRLFPGTAGSASTGCQNRPSRYLEGRQTMSTRRA